jgi:YidC/Oxa1 family membrane protein insertase
VLHLRPRRPRRRAARRQRPGAAAPAAKGETITVRTDLIVVEIDTLGADPQAGRIAQAQGSQGLAKNLVLLGPEHRYEAQSGLTGNSGPNHRSLWQAKSGSLVLGDGQETLDVRFTAQGADGLEVTKLYRFKRNSYSIDVVLEIRNGSSAAVAPAAYFQFTHDGKSSADANAVAETFGAQSFNGFAVYTEEQKFQKVHLTDVDKGKADYVKQANDGWLAYVQHYFRRRLDPAREAAAQLRGTEARRRPVCRLCTAAGGQHRARGERQRRGAAVRRSAGAEPPQLGRAGLRPGGGLRLADHHRLAAVLAARPVPRPVGNWGVAIILLTVLIKAIFFPLSAASYKSMAKMKLITPRMQKIREMHEHDRTKMNQAMMELYKTEKINPLGGCFPILVQIPVFIALYWVLLAAIELRHAPFVLWIKDLSALDPYYVLPILMTVTMILQTRMNPVPPDPVQAKVMQFMPFIFSVFFFFFPAGLVLYWLVNNILSIAQQWQIQRMFDRDKTAHAKR